MDADTRRYGRRYKHAINGTDLWRFWSTDSVEQLKPAILLLVCSGCNFQIVIEDYAYKTKKNVKLTISRNTQYIGDYAPTQTFCVRMQDETKDLELHEFQFPEEAVEKFFEIWKNSEVGDYWVDVNFCGHGGGGWDDITLTAEQTEALKKELA